MACSCGCHQRPISSRFSSGVQRRRSACVPRPATLPIGELRGLIYRSRKSPGEAFKTYVHFFKERLPILSANTAGTQLYIFGGGYKITKRGIQG